MRVKKQKVQKNCFMKRKLKFKDYKNCLEEDKIENKINHLEEKETDVGSPKQFIINSKLISKTQQRFKSERNNVFTKEINKIAIETCNKLI